MDRERRSAILVLNSFFVCGVLCGAFLGCVARHIVVAGRGDPLLKRARLALSDVLYIAAEAAYALGPTKVEIEISGGLLVQAW